MRERPFFKSLTEDDSLIPFPVSSLTKRNRDRKNVQTKYQPITTRRNTISRLNITENAARKISVGISIKRNERKKKYKGGREREKRKLRPRSMSYAHNYISGKFGANGIRAFDIATENSRANLAR